MRHNDRFLILRLTALAVLLSPILGHPFTALAQQEIFDGRTPVASESVYIPMTAHDRRHDYVDTNFVQSGAYFQTFFTALGDETGNIPREWGTGATAFPKHFASQFARFTIGGTVKSSVAAGLGEDTRFHACNCKGAFARAGYAASRSFLTYDGHGRTTPNIAGMAGIYSGPMIMTTWYPGRYTPWGYGVRQGNLALAITTGIDVIREFGPEIKGLLHRRSSSRK